MATFKILVVDDEESVRESYRVILSELDQSQKTLDMLASTLFDDDLFPSESGAEMSDLPVLINKDIDQEPYEIVEASQGEEAIEIIRQGIEKGEYYSLMFLDMRMPPGIDGAETARQIRQLDPYIEIVIMTAYSDYSYQEIVDEVGNPERLLYFHKPFQMEQIQQLASSLTQKWSLEKECRKQEH